VSIEALKVVYQLVVIEKDDDGNIIGEHPQEPVTLYPKQFGELEQRVETTLSSTPVYLDGTVAPAPATPDVD
jgi:hypothetical protein